MGPEGLRTALVAAVALLLAPFAVPGLTAQQAPEVRTLRFVGNDAIPSDSLEVAIANRETSCRTFFFVVIPLCPLGFDFAFDEYFLDPRELPRDALRLEIYYGQRGYREAQVTLDTTRLGDDAIRITFEIDEGRPTLVDSLFFTGEEIPDPSLLEDLPLDEGDPLSGILLEATRDTLQRRLLNAGYATADVLRNFYIPAGTYGAQVEYAVYPGPVSYYGDIDVRFADADGHSLSEADVRRFLPFEAGDRYSAREILEAQRTLFGVELIQSASIEQQLDTTAFLAGTDSVIPLTVTVQEGDVHRVRVGSGWSTADCLNVESRWVSRNFIGQARRLTVLGRVSNVLADELNDSICPQAGEDEFGEINWVASVELFQPWFLSVRNSLTASVFAERASLTDIFVRRTIGANLAIARTLGWRTVADVSYRPQVSRLQAAELFFCTSFLVCTPDDVGALQSANWLSPVGIGIARDRTDDLLNPTSGYQARLDLEHASNLTGSDFAYNRVIGEATAYVPSGFRQVLAGRIRGGWVGAGTFEGLQDETEAEIVHPQKRFYAGGANSVRGFPQNRLGPRVLSTDVRDLVGFTEVDGELVRICDPAAFAAGRCDPSPVGEGAFFPRPTGGSRLLEGNVEYRYALVGDFQGVAFLDFGQVWGERESVNLGDVELSPGAGVRFFSPIGPIRVDVGYRFRGSEPLQVVTSAIRLYDPLLDDPSDRICIVAPSGFGTDPGNVCAGDRVPIPWVRRDELSLLDDRYDYGGGGFFQKLQLHFSIGQAF